ncbi:hypothetical protein GGI21_002622, partial [Coemansia aciculifera]
MVTISPTAGITIGRTDKKPFSLGSEQPPEPTRRPIGDTLYIDQVTVDELRAIRDASIFNDPGYRELMYTMAITSTIKCPQMMRYTRNQLKSELRIRDRAINAEALKLPNGAKSN